MHQKPHSPLTLWWHCSVCVSPCPLPAPTTPSFVSIRAFRTAWWSNTVARSWICSLIQLCHPPQHTNAPFGSISHRDFCWIKAITWPPASHRSSAKMATKSRTPLTLHHRRASMVFHNVMVFQAHIHFCQLSSHWAQWWVGTDCTESGKEERASLTCPQAGDRLVLWLAQDFVNLFFFCFAYMANCPFPRAAQVL